jgi:hypothetical protein
MNTNKIKGIGTLLLLWIGLAGSPVAMATMVSIEPASKVSSVNDTFSLDIMITDVTYLYGFQFDIDFSPSILSAMSITEGSFLPSGGSTLFIPGTIDNALGTISFTGDTLLSALMGVSSNGVLAAISFQSLVAGTSPVNLSNVALLDSNLDDIAFSSQNGTVGVQGGSQQVPTPGILLLLVFGWVGFGVSRLITIRG